MGGFCVDWRSEAWKRNVWKAAGFVGFAELKG